MVLSEKYREEKLMGRYVTLLEIGRKQKYIFNSSRLAENIGASTIIRMATEEDVQKFYDKKTVKVIYEGGGNALYVFPNPEAGQEFARLYSSYIMNRYPGITLYLVGYELKDGESVKDGIDQCYKKLNQKKNNRSHGIGVIDYGATVRCASTNLPAVPHDRFRNIPNPLKHTNLSAEALKKLEIGYSTTPREFHNLLLKDATGNQYLSELLPMARTNHIYRFPTRLDDLGRSMNDKSYIAVIHIDGNGMGRKMIALNEKLARRDNESLEDFNQRYIQGLGDFSRGIRMRYAQAMKETVQELVNNIDILEKELSLQHKEEITYLPIRPLIMAGDDICFVTDGRIGVETARIFLEKLQKKSDIEEVKGMTFHACAGVAIVKAHFPFSEAYDLAEELCQNGKNQIPEGAEASYIDWHLEQGELLDSLKDIRSQYVADDGVILTMKPYQVAGRKAEQRLEDGFLHFADAMKMVKDGTKDTADSKKQIARSKVKGLRDVLHRGQVETEFYMKSNQIADILDCTDWMGKAESFGFKEMEADGKIHHIFFDAMEMMDTYIRLEDA